LTITARFWAVTAVSAVVEPVVLDEPAEPVVPLVVEPVVPPAVVPEVVPEPDVVVVEAELVVCPVLPPVEVPEVVLATGGVPEHA
jgi:hypothetical protein